jgi:uncharacterized protein (TIGR02246 family)
MLGRERLQMKNRVVPLIIALAVVAGCGQPATPGDAGTGAGAPVTLTDADKANIQEQTDKFVAAFNAGDFDAMAACYIEDGVLMPPNNPEVAGRAAIKTYIGTMPKVKDFSITNGEIEGAGDTAIVYGTFALTFVMPDGTEMKDHGKFIEVRERQSDGTWLMKRDMFSSDMPIEMPAPEPAKS